MNVQEVVIVGGGIAGLATALALQKVGVKSLVLERASKLRYEGASISLFPNAWRALKALGVLHKLQPLYQPFQTGQVTNLAAGITQEVHLGDGVMALHRKVLIEALAEELPPDSIRFSSKLVSINNQVLKDSSNVTHIELEDGTVIQAKILIGCDGVHSIVSKWLGLSTPIHSAEELSLQQRQRIATAKMRWRPSLAVAILSVATRKSNGDSDGSVAKKTTASDGNVHVPKPRGR